MKEKKKIILRKISHAMSMISCPECGKRISSMAWTCPHCGTEIKDHLVECPKCGGYMLDTQRVCKKCGNESPDTQDEEAVHPGSEPSLPGDMRPKHKFHLGLWGTVLVILTAAAAVYYGLTKYEEETQARQEAEREAAMKMALAIQEEQARQWRQVAECDSIELLEQYVKENPDSKFAGFALDRIDSLRLRKAEIRCQELARKELEKAQEPKTEPEPDQKEQQTELQP